MGDTDSQPAADGDAERADAAVELLGAGGNGQDNADVLSKTLLKSSQIEKISIILSSGNKAVVFCFLHYKVTKRFRYFPNFQLIIFHQTHVT